MYDKRERESVRRSRKLADLVAGKSRKCDNGPVERFADEDYFVPTSYARYRHVQIRIIESYRVLAGVGW
jgi:hypothetical protein